MKRNRRAIVLFLGVVAGCAAANAALFWHSGGVDLDRLELPGWASATLTLYQDDPAAHLYTVFTGAAANPYAHINTVVPLYLAHDLGNAVPVGGDEWRLTAAWSGPSPISVWGDHWEVTFEGLSRGEFFYGSGTGDVLAVRVLPEPRSAVWLGGMSLILVLARRGCGYR